MFARVKKAKTYEYLQLVESYWEGGQSRQRVLLTLGNLAHLRENGKLDSLIDSLARFSDKRLLLNLHEAEKSKPVSCVSIGGDLIFGRLWKELGIAEILRSKAASREFSFDIERAIYHTVLHRLFESGSDRASLCWRDDFRLTGTEGLKLHQLYRAMGFLGSKTQDQSLAIKFALRTVKDEIEEEIFARRRDLFTDLSMVFFDTTSTYFEGSGGESLGQYGYSKDHRPDRRQMVIGAVLDQDGMPICCEMWPGNTSDVLTISEVVKRFQKCFGIKEVCIVADRGMISAEMLEFLESPECTFKYILVVRLRKVKEVSDKVLARAGRYALIEREN